MKKVAIIIVEAGFQDEEVIYPFYRLQEADYDVVVAMPSGKEEMTGKHGIKIKGTCTLDFLPVALQKFKPAIVIVPGGWQCPELLRQNAVVLEFLKAADAEKIIIGAICHGPWVLASAGVVRGRQMTCYKGMKDDLINAGATYVDAPVVVDNNIVSAPHYRNNPEFMREVLKAADAKPEITV